MAGRRGNKEGSLRKRPDGRWEARITLSDGSRKSFYGTTRQEAAKLFAAAVRDQNVGLPIVGEKQTLEQFLAHWLEVVKPTINRELIASMKCSCVYTLCLFLAQRRYLDSARNKSRHFMLVALRLVCPRLQYDTSTTCSIAHLLLLSGSVWCSAT